VVDFVEGDDGGEFLVGEGVDDALDGFVGPFLEGLLEGEAVETAGYDGGGGAIARELVLEGFDGGGFDRDVAAFYGAPGGRLVLGKWGRRGKVPFLHEIALYPPHNF
jgi:hypothetical protein